MPMLHRMAPAEDDLTEISFYIAHDDPAAADRMFDDIEDQCLLLADQPGRKPASLDMAFGPPYSPVRR